MTRATPPERRKRLGNPSGRPLPATIAITAAGEITTSPPRGLGRSGRAAWRRIAGSPANAWLRASDYELLAIVCSQIELAAQLRKDIETRGTVVDAPLIVPGNLVYDKRPNPSLKALIEIEREISRGLSKLGLTPTDRSSLGLMQVQAENEYDKWRRSVGGK